MTQPQPGHSSSDPTHGASRRASVVHRWLWPAVVGGLVLLVVAFWASNRQPAESAVVGFVIDSQGNWIKNGKQDEVLAYNALLVDGDVVEPIDLKQEAVLTICLFNGESRQYRYQPGDKSPRHKLTGVPHSNLFSRFGRLFASRYRPLAAETLARGGDGGPLADAPALLDDAGLHLDEVFAPKFAGKYSCRFEPCDAQGQPRAEAAVVSAEFAWDSDNPQPLVIAIEPGLYRLQLLAADGQPAEGAPPAVVYVAREADYRRVERDFETAVQLSSQWPEEIAPETRLGFLRGCLLTLAGTRE